MVRTGLELFCAQVVSCVVVVLDGSVGAVGSAVVLVVVGDVVFGVVGGSAGGGGAGGGCCWFC